MNSIIKSLATSFALIIAMSFLVSAIADPKPKNLKFQSSVVCDMCKSRITTSLQKIDGVLASMVNLNNGKISVKYDPSKTNEEAIKSSILNTGYYYNETPPSAEAFSKLPDCCKDKKRH